MLLIVAGLHVPLIPLLDVTGKTGGVEPWHIGGIEANIGINIGFDSTIPIARVVVFPPFSNAKFEYRPAFRPDMITWPDPFAVNNKGPIVAPSSV